MRGKIIKYGGKELKYSLFFGSMTLLLLVLSFKVVNFKTMGIIMAILTLIIFLFSFWNLYKKIKIIKNMERIENEGGYRSYSKLYFIMDNIIFHEVIHRIDGNKKQLGIDEIGIFIYIWDKKKNRQGFLAPTGIELDRKNLNITLKALKIREFPKGGNINLEFTFTRPSRRYFMTYNKEKKGFTFHTYK